MRAQRIASRLLVELCGARLVPGTIDVGGRDPAAAPSCAARRAGPSACWGCGSSAEQCAELPRAARLRASRADGEDLEAEVPLHRHYDVTREVDLIEEVGRIHGYDEHLPSTLPGVDRAGRPADPRAGAAPPRRGRHARPRLRRDRQPQPHRPGDAGAAADRRATTRARGQIRVSNPLSRDHSRAAHDAARLAARRRPLQPRPRGRARGPVRVRPRLPARAARSRRRRARAASSPASARRRPTSRTGSPPRGRPARRAELARRAAGGRLLRAQGRARGARRPSSAPSSRSRRRPSRSCIRAAPRPSGRRRRGRLDRRAAPAGLPGLGPRGGGRLRDRPRRLLAAASPGTRAATRT